MECRWAIPKLDERANVAQKARTSKSQATNGFQQSIQLSDSGRDIYAWIRFSHIYYTSPSYASPMVVLLIYRWLTIDNLSGRAYCMIDASTDDSKKYRMQGVHSWFLIRHISHCTYLLRIPTNVLAFLKQIPAVCRQLELPSHQTCRNRKITKSTWWATATLTFLQGQPYELCRPCLTHWAVYTSGHVHSTVNLWRGCLFSQSLNISAAPTSYHSLFERSI